MDVFDLYAKISLDTSEYEKGLNDASGKTASFGDKIKNGLAAVGKVSAAAIGAGTAAVGAFAKSSVDVGMSFDAGMSQVSAIAGATGEDFDMLRNKALEMGSKTQFSATEAAEAMTYMGMAGWKTQDMLDGISGIMDLAAASGEDLATTSDIVTDALTAFGLTAADSGRFADILAAASTNANTNVGMLGESFKYVAPVAGAMGFSAEDVSVALGLMANSGIKASQAGTSLRSSLSRLVQPTKDMQSVMEALGLATIDYATEIDEGKLQRAQTNVANRTVDLEKAQLAYDEALKKSNGNSSQASIKMEELERAQTRYNEAVEKYGKDSEQADKALSALDKAQKNYNKSLESTDKNSASVQKALLNLEKAQNNLAQATYDLETAQNGQQKAVGLTNNLLVDESGNMNSLRDVMLSLRASFQGLTEEQQAQYAATLFGQEAMSGMLAIINASDEDFEKLTGAIDNSKDAAANMAEIMNDSLAGDITKFKSALEGAQIVLSDQLTPSLREFAQFGTEAIASVTEAFQNDGLSGAMDALGDVLSDGIGMISEMLPQMVDAGMQLIGALGQGILENLPEIVDAALQIISTLSQGIIEALPSLAEGAVQIISSLAVGIGEALPDLIPAAVEAVLAFLSGLTNPESMSNLLGGAVALISGLVEGLAGALPVLIAYVPEIIANLVTGLIQGIPALLEVGANLIFGLGEGLIKGLAAIPEAIARVVLAIVDGFKSLFGIHSPSTVFAEMGDQLIAGLLDGVSAAWESIVSFFSGAVDGIREIFSNITEFLGSAFDEAAQMVQSAWEGVVSFFSGIADGVRGAFEGVSAFLSDAFSSAWEAVQGAWQSAGEFFGGVWEGIQSGVGAAGEAIGGALKGAWDGIKGVWSGAKEFFGGIFNNVMDKGIEAAENVGNKLASAYNYVKEHWDEATPYFDGMWGNIKNVFGDAWNAFTEIGGNIVNGIKNGISAGWDALKSWVSEKFNSLVSGVKDLMGIHSPSTVFAGIGGNMALGLGEGWSEQFRRVQSRIENGMDFGIGSAGIQANLSARADRAAGGRAGAGDTYITINSPKAVDAIQAAREWRKTTQRIAMGYV